MERSKDRQEMRHRLRLAILTADRATVNEIISDTELCPPKELNRLDQNGRSCVLNAAFAYQLDICLDFLDAGADVVIQEKETMNTVLHYLCKAKEPTVDAQLLKLKTILHGVIAKGLNPNTIDSYGCSPLHYAARVGNWSVCHILIQYGAAVNLKSDLNETALQWCVSNPLSGWFRVAMLLLDSGADPRCLDDGGRSAISLLLDQPALTSEMREVLARMEAVKESDISEDPSQRRVRKVIAVGALAESAAGLPAQDSSLIEHRQMHGSREPTLLDLSLISECTSSSINVEYGGSGLRVVDIGAIGMYSTYQNLFFGQSHFLFVGKIPGVGCKIVAVLRMPNFRTSSYHAIVINQFGLFETWIDQRRIVGEENIGGASPRDLEQRLLDYFREDWGTSSIDFKLLDSRVGTDSQFEALMKEGDKQGSKSEAQWAAISSSKSDLPCLILGLECRLGQSKRLTIGVVLCKSGQDEEEIYGNAATPALERLLKILATKIPLEGWRSYTGGMAVGASLQSTYYTSWRGFEIVFHVATELNKEYQRQFIGNDKVLIVLAEQGAVVPQFRGNVNSVSLVLQCLGPDDAVGYGNRHLAQWGCPAELFGAVAATNPWGWRLGVFFRKRVTHYSPTLTTCLIRDETLLRDLVLANAINGHAAVMRSPPYSHPVDACFAEETERLVDRFLPASDVAARKKKP